MTNEQLSALEAAARAAGGEEWRQVKPGHPIMTPEYVVGPDPLRARAVAFGPARNFEEQLENYSRRKAETYAAYIAAANPAAVLALIARVRELEGDAVRFAWIANHGVPIMPGAPGIYPTCGKGPAVLRRAVDAAMKPGC